MLAVKRLLRGNNFSALEPPAGEHFPSTCGLHALAEAMHLFTLPFFGLVGLKHWYSTSFPISFNRAFGAKHRTRHASAHDAHRRTAHPDAKRIAPKALRSNS